MEPHENSATAERILAAAARLFAEKGFANVSVRDICRETRTSAPVLYYYFGNKKGLFDAVALNQITMTDFIGRLSAAAGAPDAKKALGAFVGVYLSSFPEHTFDLGLYLRDTATLDKRSARMAADDLEKIKLVATDIVRRGVRSGDFRKIDSASAADCLLGMMNRVIFQHIHFSEVSDREAYGKFVTDFTLHALR